jgi:hypothetical protein
MENSRSNQSLWGSFVEKSYYESKPWIFSAFALYAVLTYQKSALLFASSLILLLCSSMILHARFTHRKQIKRINIK